jgi:hypothetical protein
VDDTEIPKKSNDGFKNWASYYERDWVGNEDLIPNTQGRFPANLLVCDDMLNDGVVSKSQGGNSTNIGGFITKYSDPNKLGMKSGFGDKGTNSRYYNIDKWFDNIISE